MKRVLIALLLCVPMTAQETPKKSEADAMMEMYVEAAKPVAEHKRLHELAGPWKVTTSLWFEPDAPAHTATGTGVGKLILGGRFLQLDKSVSGAMNEEAMTIFGFDRRTNDFTLIGFDTLGTYYITAAGKHDEARKGVVFHGSYLQPPGNTEQKYHFVWQKLSDREHLLTLYFTMGTKDVRVAETRLERK